MADQQEALTQAQRDSIARWLTEKGALGSCSACGKSSWFVAEHLLHGQIFSNGNVILGGTAYPLAMIVCSNCAHSRMHLAVPMGILPAEADIGGKGGDSEQ